MLSITNFPVYGISWLHVILPWGFIHKRNLSGELFFTFPSHPGNINMILLIISLQWGGPWDNVDKFSFPVPVDKFQKNVHGGVCLIGS